MSKLTNKVAIPIILASVFALLAFIAMNYGQINPDSYVVIVLFFIFSFFFGLNTGRNLAEPVKKILDRAVDLNKGDFKTRVYLETKDELADLARVFNEIAERLEESQLNQAESGKSVDIKVRAKTKDLEETINALEQKIKNRTIEFQRVSDELKRMKEEPKKETMGLKKEEEPAN